MVAHRVNQAEAEYAFQEAELEQTRQEVEREVRQAFREVKLARIARDSSRLQVEQARESVRIAQGQYRAGLAGFTVVNEQQRELVRTQGEQTLSTFNYLTARARLAQAVGAEVLAEPEL